MVIHLGGAPRQGSAGVAVGIDTSSLQRFTQGIEDIDTELVRIPILARDARISPIVLTEAMSDPGVSTRAVSIIRSVPLLDFHDGYWLRAGQLRAELRARGFKAGAPTV